MIRRQAGHETERAARLQGEPGEAVLVDGHGGPRAVQASAASQGTTISGPLYLVVETKQRPSIVFSPVAPSPRWVQNWALTGSGVPRAVNSSTTVFRVAATQARISSVELPAWKLPVPSAV